MNPTETARIVDIREVEGPIIKPELVPQHVAEDIAQVTLEGFERYWRDCCNDPEMMRRHRERIAAFKRRNAAREAARRAAEEANESIDMKGGAV